MYPCPYFWTSAPAIFIYPPNATDVIDQGVFIGGGLCDKNIDGENRDTAPDLGADEIACSPDFNGDSDGDIDGSDLAIIASDISRTDCPQYFEN